MRNKAWIILSLNILFSLNLIGQESVNSENIIGKQAPGWCLKDKIGKIHCLSDYKGKLLLIEFLSTKCGACKLAIKDVNEIDSKYKLRNFAVIGILDSKSEFQVYAFAKGFQLNDINYLTLVDGDKYIGEYHVHGIPTFFLIDKNGKVIYKHLGAFNDNTKRELTDIIDKNL